MTELLVIENLNPAAIFVPGGIEGILDKVREEVFSEVYDVSTDKGRKGIASAGYKVATSKTAVDAMGKGLADRLNAQLKPINAERKIGREGFDKIKEEVLQPLTEWKAEKKEREDGINDRIDDLVFKGANANSLDCMGSELSSTELKTVLTEVKSVVIDDSFGEMAAKAAHVKDAAVTALEARIIKREKYEADQAELLRLQEENEQREKQEAEDRIRKEEAERVRKEEEQVRIDAEAAKQAAEQRLIDEQERSEREAKEAAEKVEADIKAADERAEREKQEAIDAERERVAQEKRDDQERERVAKQKADKAASNKAHQKKLNNQAVDCFVTAGMTKEAAVQAVTWIAKGMIKNVTINYLV